MTQNTGALTWDTQIDEDAMEFELIPAGTYDFKVKLFEPTIFTPSGTGKIDVECPQANLQLEIVHDNKTFIVFDQLILHTSTQGFISAFFTSIGQKEKGVPFTPDWKGSMGMTGTVKIKHETYNKVTRAKVDRYLPKETTNAAPTGW